MGVVNITSAMAGAGPGRDTGVVIATPEETRLWEWLEDVATESGRVRQEEARFDQFDTWIDLYYGRHWPKTIPSFRPPIVINELRTLILNEASELTEGQPRVYITKDPRRGTRDEQLEAAFRAVWARQQIDLKLLQACVWALVVGTGFIEVGWDPDEHHGLGDVVVNVADPRTVLPDPDAVDDKTWLYRIREQVLDIHEIRRLFPVSGMRVRPDDNWSIKDNNAAPTGLDTPAYIGPLTPSDTYLHGTVPGYKKARARVLDCIMKDDSVEEVTEPDPNHPMAEMASMDNVVNGDEQAMETPMRTVLKARYPEGRRIVGANGIILYDGPNPNAGGDFGLLRVVLEPTPDRFWGSGFVQQTAELQLAADKLASNVVENAVRLNNGIIVSTTNTGLDWETFAGIPAQIVQINPGSEFKIQYPPPMPPDMIKAPWTMLDLQRRLLGFQDARAGFAARGNVSAELTETEISQAQATTRLRARMLHGMVQRLAEMIFSRMASGYRTERAIPSVDGEAFKPVTWEPLEDPKQYAIHVDPASFTIMSKTMMRRLSVVLYKLRGIDRRALLDMIGFPDAAMIADRLDKQDMAIAQAKAAKKK